MLVQKKDTGMFGCLRREREKKERGGEGIERERRERETVVYLYQDACTQ